MSPKKEKDVTEQYNVCIDIDNLMEATVNEEDRTVTITAIRHGWSKNGNYYSKKVAESLSKLLKDRSKIYVNHQMRPVGDRRYLGGRDMRDWSAQVLEAWGEEGRTKAKIHVFEEPDGWLFERVKKFPEEVGLSIDARALVKSGEAEGKKGTIVEGFVKLNSVDFVPYASAGGRVERLAAMEKECDDKLIGEFKDALAESEETDAKKVMTRFFDRIEEGDEPKKIVYDLMQELSVPAKEEPTEEPTDDKLTEDDTTTHGGDTDVEIKEITLEQLQVGNPTLVEAIKESVKNEMDEENSVAEKDAKIAELESENEALKTEKENLKKEVDDYKVAEALAEKKAKVEELLAESKLPEEAITDTFREQLNNAKDEDAMNALIADRKALVEKDSGKIEDNNSEERTTEGEDKKEPVTKEDVLKTFKR